MASPPSMREAVLAWMRETGKGPAEAARRFRVPVSRVKQWASRERRKHGDGDTSDGDKPVTMSPSVTSPTPRKRASKATEKSSPPEPPPQLRRAAEKAADALEGVAADLAEAARVRAKWLATEDSVGAKHEQSTAITLGIVLDKLHKLQEKGGGSDSGEDDSDAAAERVRRALEGGAPPGQE